MHASPRRYHGLSIALHWLMLLLIAAVYACIELKGNFPRGSEPRELLKQWHFALGMLVWALVWAVLVTVPSARPERARAPTAASASPPRSRGPRGTPVVCCKDMPLPFVVGGGGGPVPAGSEGPRGCTAPGTQPTRGDGVVSVRGAPGEQTGGSARRRRRQ